MDDVVLLPFDRIVTVSVWRCLASRRLSKGSCSIFIRPSSSSRNHSRCEKFSRRIRDRVVESRTSSFEMRRRRGIGGQRDALSLSLSTPLANVCGLRRRSNAINRTRGRESVMLEVARNNSARSRAWEIAGKL